MASSHKRRHSTRRVSRQNVKSERDSDMDNPFAPTDTSGAEQESDVSEYGKRESKRKIKRKKPNRGSSIVKYTRMPSPPGMSDVECDVTSGSPALGDYIEVRKRTSTPFKAVSGTSRLGLNTLGESVRPASPGDPTVLQIHLNAGAAAGGTTINLDLSDLVLSRHTFDETGSASLPTPDGSNPPVSPTRIIINNKTGQIRSAAPGPSSRHVRMPKEASSSGRLFQKVRIGFCDIPFELRVRVYRQVFVTEAAIEFASRENFNRSSSLLRTCQLVYHEGRAVLYGENAFHFERSPGTRGAFFESTWKEIGFKDARRFLETIGPANISLMRYVSFHFQDAAPSTTPHLDDNERRFVNDPILHHILRLIGGHARLSKIAFQFSGRKLLQKFDYNFLQALSSIKSEEVIHAERMTYALSKVGDLGIVEKLQRVMTVPRADEEGINMARKKKPTVKMFHERRGVSHHHAGGRH